uniref:ABC transporter permease n=1 Tax=Polysiphonia sertularioides TaxID=945028 RepID=A0A1Z1M953_9FLOR|nr:hypothetical protein [Polysiphonia sertularioides]ARW62423.1 hypothetical protein [Polysiphonia sertularioides]
MVSTFFYRFHTFCKILISLYIPDLFSSVSYKNLLRNLDIVGINVLFVTLTTSFFISLVLSLQIVKEFLYLNAVHLVSSILAISFIRELSPILTAIVVIGKVGSFFTAEIGTMVITEQIDSMFVLGINPIKYLIYPRLIALLVMLPLLDLFSLFTSLISSSFICFFLYDISPGFFFSHLFYINIISDCFKSLLKMLIFGFVISMISCAWGLTTVGGSQGVGISTTSSVVTSLISVFLLNFILSYFLFDNLISSFSLL